MTTFTQYGQSTRTHQCTEPVLGPCFFYCQRHTVDEGSLCIRSVLSRAGVPIDSYLGHSFRIGATTTVAQAMIHDSTIQALGR